MRKPVSLVLTLLLLAGICIWAGCGVGSVTGATAGTEQGQGETEETPAWVQKYPDPPSLKDLGVPEYPPSVMDQSSTEISWEDPDQAYETFVYEANECPVVNVAAFYRDALKGMSNLKESAAADGIKFQFETADGVPMEIAIFPQDSANPAGPSEIYITVNPEGQV